MTLRTAKVMLVFAVALFYSLVVLNNTTDYNSNFQFIRHVLMMDSTFPGNRGMWRALNSPAWHTMFYLLIIGWEGTTMALLWWGGIRLTRTLHGPAATFNNSGTVNVQSGTLRLSGGGTLSGTFNISSGATAQFNNAFLLTGIAVFFGGAVTGTGSISIGNGARAEFSSAVNGPAVTFASGSGTLTLDNPSTFQSPISGLAIGDTINFLNTQVTSATINGSALTISTTS